MAIQSNGGNTRVYVDMDGDGNLVSGQDLVIELTGDVTNFLNTVADYVF